MQSTMLGRKALTRILSRTRTTNNTGAASCALLPHQQASNEFFSKTSALHYGIKATRPGSINVLPSATASLTLSRWDEYGQQQANEKIGKNDSCLFYLSKSPPVGSLETVDNKNRRRYTTSSGKSDATILYDESTSSSELVSISMDCCRQGDADQAEDILYVLQSRDDVSLDDLSAVKSSIIAAWVQNQKQSLRALDEYTTTDTGQHDIILHHLENICHAADRASRALEGIIKDMGISNSKVGNVETKQLFTLVLQAWANCTEARFKTNLPRRITTKVMIEGIPQRMNHFLRQQGVLQNSNSEVEWTNQILKAWACSDEHLRGTMAEQAFKSIDEPNGDSFRWIIRAWCWSNERPRAYTATGHHMRMLRLFETTGRVDMEPTMDDYHVLFKAWTTAGDKNAPSKVYTLLQYMEDAFSKGFTQIRPDEQCYRDALITMSRKTYAPEVGEFVDRTLSSMKDRAIIPDNNCYSAAILAWKNVATNLEVDDRDASARRTLQLLREMILAYHRTTKVLIRPTVENYNHVLEALAVTSRTTKAVVDAEMLLQAMEEASRDNDPSPKDIGESFPVLQPTIDTYRLVLDVWSKSKSPDKVPRAWNILKRLLGRIDKLSTLENPEDQSAVVSVFNSFIKVCSRPSVDGEAERTKILKVALNSAEELQKMGLKPNAATYVALMIACQKLIREGVDRQRMLENVFRRCCEAGFVDQSVLSEFQSLASSYLYAKLVVAHSREVEGIKVVPESWTRNNTEFLVKTKEGRKVLPLSIDGKFTVTLQAKEHKMRNLRVRRNQRFLRGGRM